MGGLGTTFYQYDFWGQIFNFILVLIFIFYLYVMGTVLYRNYRDKHPSRRTLILGMICWTTITVMIILSLIDSTRYDPLIVYPWNYYACVFFVGWFVICYITNQIARIIQIKQKRIIETRTEFKANPNAELHRKITHVFANLILLTFVVFPYLFYFINETTYLAFPQNYSPEIMHNTGMAGALDFPTTYYAALPCLFLVYFGALFVQIISDVFFNVWPNYYYPFKNIMIKSIRQDESGSFGTHVHMVMGYTFGTAILSYNKGLLDIPLVICAIYAMISAGSLGDLVACLVGKKWGKKKWKWYPSKSYIGTIAGALVSFGFTLIFTGIWFALISIFIFFLSDIPFSKIKLSDNITYPILFAIVVTLAWDLMIPLIIPF